MTFKDLERRIRRMTPSGLLLKCRTGDGKELEMTVDECIASNATFIRVVSGNDLSQVDRLLNFEIKQSKAPRWFRENGLGN